MGPQWPLDYPADRHRNVPETRLLVGLGKAGIDSETFCRGLGLVLTNYAPASLCQSLAEDRSAWGRNCQDGLG